MAKSSIQTAPGMTVEVLPASFGDCLLVTCTGGFGEWRLLVDTGPDETYDALARRLARLPLEPDRTRHIDLFIVSHIDHDHIGGAVLLLNDPSLNLSFGDIWFNAPPPRVRRGVAEGRSLARLLGATDRALPWNLAFGGEHVVTPAVGGGIELSGPGSPRLTLLSPTPDRLTDLFSVWDREVARLRRKEHDERLAARGGTRGAAPSLETLAAQATPNDRAVANGSSIAVLLEHAGRSVLLAADAFADVLVPALQALAARRASRGPLKFDAIKLSHHASSANITTELVSVAQADHYIVSTNNTHFDHPDAEALARVIVHSQRPTTLWFNHDTGQNRLWGDPRLVQRHGHAARYPAAPDAGVRLDLAGRLPLRH